MSDLVLLRRTLLANPDTQPGAPAQLAIELNWDTTHRTYYATQRPASNLQAFELPVGTVVQTITVLSTGQNKLLTYAGNGQVVSRRVAAGSSGTPPAACTLAAPQLTPNPPTTSYAGASDASLDVLPQRGTGPYHVRLTGPGNFDQTETAPNALYPVRFYSLADANDVYTLAVTDAQGCQFSTTLRVNAGLGKAYGFVLQESYYGDDTSGTGSRTIWNPNSLAVEHDQYTGGGTDGYQYQSPSGDALDGYYLPDGVTFRRVYSDGSGGVYFQDSSSAATGGQLTLENLILFSPDSQAEQNGAVIVEVLTPDLPVSFTLGGLTNQTGRFDGLATGDYTVACVDAAGNSLSVPFMLTLAYAPRWVLAADTLEAEPWRVELWLRGYQGQPDTVYMQGEAPVTLASDGLSGTLGGQGDVGPVVGSSAELNFLCAPGTFEQVLLNDDRACRADVYHNGLLVFRGYVQPDIYHEPLLSGLLAVSLTATDGLAGLKDTDMLGHVGQRLATRRPILHTLLHCLSRCGISLPLLLAVNRREIGMGDDDAPEELISTDRGGYWDKADPVDMRGVVEGLCQALGGTLVQRQGTWQVRSLLEAATAVPARTYLPGGTPALSRRINAPAATVKPLGDLATALGWQDGSQQQQVRPGWKSLTGTTDAGWRTNAFVPGQVFSDKYAFLTDGSQLRPINGWVPAAGASFPLVLIQGGQKGTDYATQWLRSSTPETLDGNYLQSPALPLEADPESCPALLTVKGKLVPADYLQTPTYPAVAGTATKALLSYEIVIDGQRPATPGVLTFPLAANLAAADTTLTVPLPTLPAGAKQAVLRLFAWTAPDTDALANAPTFTGQETVQVGQAFKFAYGANEVRLYQSKVFGIAGAVPAPSGDTDQTWQRIAATDAGSGQLLLSEVGIELEPQNATWDSTDNFRADGPAGTVRPTEALAVTHPDVPIQAGLFEGNRFAFSKAVAYTDGSLTTAWARALDKAPSPMFESVVLDQLALRAGQSKLLTGVLRYRASAGGRPLALLDAVDTPYDVPGRRFIVAALRWEVRNQTQEVSLLEIGAGADTLPPVVGLPVGVRITHQLYAYQPGAYVPVRRRTQGGLVRVRH